MESNKKYSLTITKIQQGPALTLHLDGRLDAITCKDLNTVLETCLNGVNHLTFELEKLSYISSAGLRSLLLAQKSMGKQGKMVVRGANEIVLETFHSIGFDRIMTIE